MAIFTNDLSFHLTMIQHEEILDSINKKHERLLKEMNIKLSVLTGSVVAASTISVLHEKPEVILLTLASLALGNSVFDLFSKHRYLKKDKIDINDLENIDYRKIARENREDARYKGKLQHLSPYRFELENKEEIEEEFGYSSDNDLPIHFLEQELVPNQVLHEYELFAKRYEVPSLLVTEDELVKFVDRFSELLKIVNQSHRIYYYTSEYMKRLLAKGIVNYWDEIAFDTLISSINIFEQIGLLKEDIEVFKMDLAPKEVKKL